MDLIATLRSKIDTLPNGDYSTGLVAVLSHIENAFRHLSRGQTENEESLFTDVIYRCNQAFEGSIKEAYRVLANKDPSKKTPFKIEEYLDKNNVFRERVLAQFTNYRTEWRNPSTHDYILDFDESEAFLAIVSVSAFACVLIDQISRELAFEISAKETDEKKHEIELDRDVSLIELATEIFQQFSRQHTGDEELQTEIQLMGALAGFTSTLVPNVERILDFKLDSDTSERGDLLLSHENERVLVELKRTNRMNTIQSGVSQLVHYMSLTDLDHGILFAYPPGGGEVIREEIVNEKLGLKIVVLRAEDAR